MLRKFLSVSLLLACSVRLGSCEKGCPDEEEVTPCTCKVDGGSAYLTCPNVNDAEDLRRVFQNSARFTYNKVMINSSSLQYLPHDLFDSVKVNELFLVNLTLGQLFDSPPQALEDLYRLEMKNTVLIRGELWRLLEPLTNLKLLAIYENSIKSLGKEFHQYAPKGLRQLTLVDTKTRSLEPGVFNDFTQLETISLSGTLLEELSRKSFPEPFNGKALYFPNNAISKLSDDMFHKMPNLKFLILNGNQLSGLSETAFDGNFGNLDTLYLSDNPLKCDCLLQWIPRYKPANLMGKCVKPKSLNGRELRDLEPSDFPC